MDRRGCATATASAQRLTKAISDPIGAWLDRLRRLARSEMKAGGLPWAAHRDVVIDLERFRLDPDLSPGLESKARSGITELRQRRPLRWNGSRKARYIAQHGRDRYLNHPERLTPIGRLLREARDKGESEQFAAHRAISAACLAACVDLVEKATDRYDQLLLGVCIDYWQHQLDVERTRSNLQGRRGSTGGSHGKGKAKRAHNELIGRALKQLSDTNVWLDPKLGEVLDVLESDGVRLSEHVPLLPIVGVEVDGARKKVVFEYDPGHRVTIGFDGIRKAIEKAKQRLDG